MKKKSKLFYLALSSAFLFVGCNEENIEEKQLVQEQKVSLSRTKKEKFKEETSLLIGRILADKNVRDEVLSEMKKVSKNAEVISFGYLLKKDKGIRKNEKSKLSTRSIEKKSLFSQAINEEFKSNEEDYTAINELIQEKKKIGIASRLIYDIIGDVLYSENLQLYSPYNEMNPYDTAAYSEYYTSNEMEDGSPTNSGYYFNGVYETFVPSMDNDFIDSNPSFIISVIDACDLEGGVCTTEELYSVQPSLNNEVILTLPPPLNNEATLLTYSVDHANIPDADIITSRIPMIKINGTSWMAFGGTHQKLRLFRGSYEGGMTQNADGTISVTGLKYQIGSDFRVRRGFVRRGDWVTFDRDFDPDWDQSENTQQIVVFSLHHWKSSDEFSAGVKYGLKKDDKGNWSGTPEVTGSASVKFTADNAKFRSNAELARRQILSSITGLGSTGSTYTDGGVGYNVKSVGIVDYYFKHWYTDLQ